VQGILQLEGFQVQHFSFLSLSITFEVVVYIILVIYFVIGNGSDNNLDEEMRLIPDLVCDKAPLFLCGVIYCPSVWVNENDRPNTNSNSMKVLCIVILCVPVL